MAWKFEDFDWLEADDMESVSSFKMFEIIGRVVWANYFLTFDWSIDTNPKLSLLDILAQMSLFSGESFPQLVISIIFIANNGGVETHPWNTASAVFSAGSVIIGIITSVMAYKNGANDDE